MGNTTNIMTLNAPPKGLQSSVHIPGDKSVSHRCIMLSSIAEGKTDIYGLLESEDVLATIEAFRKMGVTIEQKSAKWTVVGVGLRGLQQPKKTLNFGNSGTTARLMMGILAGQNFTCTIDGDKSLRSRPMKRVTDHLIKMGAKFKFLQKDGCLPIEIVGQGELKPLKKFELPIASAQIKSAIMFATLYSKYDKGTHPTRVIEKSKSRNHSEILLRSFGARAINQSTIFQGEKFLHGKIKRIYTCYIAGGRRLQSPRRLDVPADPSSAAFFTTAALIVPNSKITMKKVGINETRTGFITACQKKLGLDVKITNEAVRIGEDAGDIVVQYQPITAKKDYVIPKSYAPLMIDEYPILSVLAATLDGSSVTMEGIGELRVKESDRIEVMEKGLKACGVKVESGKDWMKVYGTDKIKGGARITTHLDHRIAMSFLILGLVAENPITIDDASPVSTSFPNFFEELKALGVDYKQ